MATHSALYIPAKVLEAVWTKFQPITSPTSRVRSKKPAKIAIFGHFWTLQNNLNMPLSIKKDLLSIFGGPTTFRWLRWAHYTPAEPIRSAKSQKPLPPAVLE